MKDILLLKIQKSGPIKRRHLLLSIQFHFQDLKDRRMRKLIEELIRDGHVIASSKEGYSIVTNVRELTEAVEYLKAPLRSASIRANTLIGNFNLKYHSMDDSSEFKLEL